LAQKQDGVQHGANQKQCKVNRRAATHLPKRHNPRTGRNIPIHSETGIQTTGEYRMVHSESEKKDRKCTVLIVLHNQNYNPI
jgi:hypothetical protein